MNIIKKLARKILSDEISAMNVEALEHGRQIAAAEQQLITVGQQRELAAVRQENDDLKVDLFQSSQIIHHHEKRIQQMAPEKQFLVVAVDGTVLEQEMVYSSDGKTRITVRLPIGHPWKQATELAQQLELANLTIERARVAFDNDPDVRRAMLGFDKVKAVDGK